MQTQEVLLNSISSAMSETIQADPVRRKKGEDYLSNISTQPGFPLLLLQLLGMNIAFEIRQMAAIYFKNFVKSNWVAREDSITIPEEDRNKIKAGIVGLMLSVEPRIRKVVSTALGVISESDFPFNWTTLLPELVEKFGSPDWNIVNGVLKTVHSILRRYRHIFKSETVLKELVFILKVMQVPYHQLFTRAVGEVDGVIAATSNNNNNNTAAAKVLFETINLLFKIFNSLNAVDLPEYFEDNMKSFMDQFGKFLRFTTNIKAITEDSTHEEKPGLLDKIQTRVCENVNLYIEKYEEEFAPHLPSFVTDVWTLLSKTDNSPAHDALANAMISFLTSVAKSVHHSLFAPENVLQLICVNIVIPNMRLREVDEEMFEDNPVEYIRRDVEGSDTDTRRRAALELVKGLRKHYESQVTTICYAHITNMLAEYTKNPAENWALKDTVIYLVSALAVRSATAAKGITTTNNLINILDFFQTQITSALTSSHPILKSDALKFIATFRSQLPQQVYIQVFPQLVESLASTNYVVHTYSASCIERMLTVKDAGVPRFSKEILTPHLATLLQNSFAALAREESKENEYVMKAVMRVVGVAGSDLGAFAPECIKLLCQILATVAANPTNPSFNHYMFEAVAAILKNSPSHLPLFEQFLFPIFQQILGNDIIEFSPYVFQLLALMVESSHPPVSPTYMGIFPVLLTPELWARKGNIPPLVRLLEAFMKKQPDVVGGGKLDQVLGIFAEKLNKSQMHDQDGFRLLEAIVDGVPLNVVEPYLPKIFTEIFGRLTRNKTVKYVKAFLVFSSLFISKYGPTAVITPVDTLQAGLFRNILDSLYIPHVGKVNGTIERKMCAIAITKLLTESQELVGGTYSASWGPLLQALLSVLELPEDRGDNGEFDDDDELDVAAGSGYSNAYSPLVYAMRTDTDPYANVIPQQFLATQMHKLAVSHPGKVAPMIKAAVNEPAQQLLTSYFQKALIPEPYLP
eukprot:TRINITY_DN5802_c0_g1_i1.p1 TRINITY_DN5802_c0_g1~~TRINITY_DN5802_c0_g1_i1.p1  ORF type:complete len:996 (-),score=247.01 TRINITY_DN5802_c0_g1_i1:79-3003(-)